MFHVTRRRVGSASASNGKSSPALAMRRASTLRKADGVPLPNQGSAYTRGNPVRVRLERGSVVHDWIPQDTIALEKLAWLIYLTDGVIGPALDFYREVPFGPVILSGVKDARRLRLYNDCLDALNVQRFLPYLAGDILVSGRNIIHLVMNERRGYWTELISHMTQHVQIQPSPILGQNPTIDLMVPPEYQRWAASTDPRVVDQHQSVDPELLQMLAAGRVIPLDPECVTGNTLVDTARGLIPAAALCTRMPLDVATHRGHAQAERCWYTGVKPIQHVRTQCGFDLRTSHKHPYWTVQPDLTLVCKDAQDLKPGDLVGIRLGGTWPSEPADLRLAKESTETWCSEQVASGSLHCIRKNGGVPTEMSEAMAHTLGYLISEGTTTQARYISFCNNDPNVMDDYVAEFSACFPDFHLAMSTRCSDLTRHFPNYYQTEVRSTTTLEAVCSSRKLRRFLVEVGLDYSYSHTKTVPWSILQSTDQHVGAFLSTYFEGDGGCAPKRSTVNGYSTSRTLLQQVQVLLAKLGIVSRLTSRRIQRRRIHTLLISGVDQLTAFREKVGFRSPRKQAQLDAIINSASHQRGSRIAWTTLGKRITEAVVLSLDEKRLGHGRAGYSAPDGSRVVIKTGHQWKERTQRASEYQLEDLNQVDPELAQRIRTLKDLPVFWDAVEKTREEPAEPVYNLYVPGHESFVANGICTHNCTVFVPRRASTNDNMGTTLLTRTFAIAALEWAMMDAEATGLRRRASPLTVITAGIENIWEASPDELQAIMELVLAAEEDVVHPTIALRNGIEIHTESGWSELTKWMEQWDVLKNAKLQAIGMNEAFASGEASWCLPGNSLISTSKGLLRMKDIPNCMGLSLSEAEKIGKVHLDGSGLLLTTGKGEHAASTWAYSGKKQVRRVTTESGYTLDGTDEHPVLVLTPELKLEWTKIKDLKEGDVVALRREGLWPNKVLDLMAYRAHAYEAPHITYRRRHARNLRDPALPKLMSDDLAHLLGYLVSEGDCTDRERFIFGNTDSEVLSHYQTCHQRVFPDQHLSCDIVEGSTPFTSVTTGSWVVREFLHQIGLTFAHSAKKEVPWSILHSPRAQVAKFLSAMFEGDGSATHGIEYCSVSQKLVRQVQQLLLKFDILSKVEPNGDRWRVRVTGREEIQRFVLAIDFVSSTKKEAARQLLRIESRPARRRWQYLGARIKSFVSKALDVHSHGTRYRDSQGNVVCAAVRNWRLHVVSPESESSDTLLQELSKIDSHLSKRIEYLWGLPYFWDSVDHVASRGIQPVYDLCVPEHESYVANGFVVHNSYLESMLSLGMERIRNFRRFIAQEIILEGILAPLARLHGFYKSPQNNADHRIRTATRIDANLDLPTVEWARSLQPTTDRDYLDILVLLQENGLPIPLRKWAQAGGYDIDEAVEGMNEDIALRKRLKYYQEQIEGIGSEALGTEGIEGEPTEAKAARVRRALRWRGGEFLGLRKPDVERHLAGCRFPLDQSGWHQLETRLRDSGVHDDSIRALEYGVSRAGLLNRPLSRESIVVVRDELLKTRPLMSQAVTSDLKYLNRQLDAQAPSRRNGRPNLSFTIPPATPKLLTGEGYAG
jgi:intein/homing endonuclease